MAGRLKNQWKKLLPDAISFDHHHQQQRQQEQEQQQQQPERQQQQPEQQHSSTAQDSSSSSSGSSASTPAHSPVTAISSATASDSLGLKATKEKLKNIGLPSNFRKLRMKFLRHKKESIGIKEENTEFEKVAVQQRPAKSKKKKQSVLKWKEGAKPASISADESKKKRKYHSKKKKRQDRKKKKLKLTKLLTAEPVTETEKEQKTVEKESKTTEKEEGETEKEQKTVEKESKITEKEEGETEMDAEEQTFTEAKEEESEFESTPDAIDRRKKETPSTADTSDTSVGSKTPSESSSSPSQISQESTLIYPTIKNSEELIPPLTSSNQEPVPLVTAEAANASNVSSNNRSQKTDSSSTIMGFDMMFDDEPIILSTPACQVLGIIMKKQFFKNAAASETENDLIRMYFAGKIPPGREKDAQKTLEKAVNLAVTRVKSSGLSEDLYSFLNNNRVMAISLIIDAMKYRQKEFLPEFWTYNRMSKKEPPPESPF